ncbi:MAG: hypothetical protein M3N33_11740 [Actinomycetota bacterium]|nr:hypothetical protein [Actinomycetota bacterium]
MVANGGRGEAMMQEQKKQLVKAARMLAMCQKADVPEPLDVTGLAVAAFEDMQLREAMLFVRMNEQNIKDLAWALGNSNSAEEFEKRVKEIKTLPDRNEPRR